MTRTLLALILVVLTAVPAHAESFLIFRKKGNRYPETSTEVWRSKNAPVPGRNLPADALVIPLKPGQAPSNVIRVSERLEPKPAPQVEAREPKETLRSAAADKKIDDATWLKKLRESYAEQN